MIDATVPCARMRELACLGRSSASHAQAVTDAASIGNVLILRPRATSPRPETDVPAASII
jgi:hypothetical protein